LHRQPPELIQGVVDRRLHLALLLLGMGNGARRVARRRGPRRGGPGVSRGGPGGGRILRDRTRRADGAPHHAPCSSTISASTTSSSLGGAAPSPVLGASCAACS